jgi:phosphoglycolate phosphatase-like HAD superfamily hydrolase
VDQVSSNTAKNVRACLANGTAPKNEQGGGDSVAAAASGLQLELEESFDFIWGIDNSAFSKADSLAAASRELGQEAERIVYIGDTTKDAVCAQGVGMGFIGANWGGFEDMAAVAVSAAEEGAAVRPFAAVDAVAGVFAEVERLLAGT